jgi:hypothetical protein
MSFIPAILQRHLAELEYLWARRQTALRDECYNLWRFSALEERIEVHLEGVLAAGHSATAYSLLHLGGQGVAQRVGDAFAGGEAPRLDGLRMALCHAPLQPLEERMGRFFHSGPAPLAAAAGEALAFHSALRDGGERIGRFLVDDTAEVRQAGWRLVGYQGVAVRSEDFATAVQDEPAVRSAALHAAAWCREREVLRVCRELAEGSLVDNIDVLQLLAILGAPEDLPLMRAIGCASEIGPTRFRLLASYGHPDVVDLLLEGMRDTDTGDADAAGIAFLKLTGRDALSSEQASDYWESVRPELAETPRLCRGLDLRRGLAPEVFATLDMESRWEICLRSKYTGVWNGSPISLEVFPQRRS